MVAAETENSTSHCDVPVLAKVLKDKLMDTIKVEYDAARDGATIHLLNLVGEVFSDITQQGGLTRL